MTDETRPGDEEQAGTATVAGQAEAAEPGEEGDKKKAEVPVKLTQTVETKDIGPCKKHIKVSVSREDVDRLLDKKFSELVTDAPVAGFRPGKAPRKIIERRYQKEVSTQVRGDLMMASLEQLAEENDIAPLTAPNINPDTITVTKGEPFVYEFDVEVRPEFELPNYKGLKLKRPVKTFTDEDVVEEERRVLAPHGVLVPKPEGNAQISDYLVCDLTALDGDRVLSTHKEITIRVDHQLALPDGVAERFGAQVKSANGGETRTVEVKLSDAVAMESLRGKTVALKLDIKEIKTVRLPELTQEFLGQFGVRTHEQLRERIRVVLQRRLEYEQRMAARKQVLDTITTAGQWDLPQGLLQRQARRSFDRRIMEMRSAGMSDNEIQARIRLLQQDALRTTAQALKEHFVLQKIAEIEKIDITEDDIDDEIEHIAVQTSESPRRVRARLEREDQLEALAAQIIEAKTLDLILKSAEYEDIPYDRPDAAVGTVETQAVPGELRDPTEVPAEEIDKEPTAGQTEAAPEAAGPA